MEGLTVIIVDS